MAFGYFGASRMSSPWTTEITEQMVKLWKGGMSASQIAKLLGIPTRNAVIGKVHRMGREAKRENPSEPKFKAVRLTKDQRLRAANIEIIKIKERYRQPKREARPPQEAAGSTPRPWMTRTLEECAFPVSGDGADTYSCCAPIYTALKFPYCPEHLKVMTEPKSRRRRSPPYNSLQGTNT